MSKILDVLTTFKYSANIKADYTNLEKIDGFYATSGNVHTLAKLADTVLHGSNKSLMISGAYGTGKSFLISVLVSLLTGSLSAKSFALLKKKIESTSPDSLIPINAASKGKYIVVFPNDMFDSFSQALSVGIDEAFKRNGINVVLKSSYQLILEKISRWEQSHQNFFAGLKKALRARNISLSDFRADIENFSPVAYQIFEDAYPEFMGGENFLPIGGINAISSLLKNVEDVALQNGFSGAIYVFDEFGRYLEKNIDSLDVKEIQDVAEYCNSGVKSSLFLITHKDIFQYSKRIRLKEMRNEWEKVSGRFLRTHFNYEPTNTLCMMKSILQKRKDQYVSLVENNIGIFNGFADLLDILGVGSPEQTIHDFYPLSYTTAMALPKLSQKLAQNERTLFAFLCGDEPGGLLRIFKNNSSSPDFITIDKLYDFFEANFKFLEPESSEYKVYINARDVISNLRDFRQIQLVKALAILYIINEFNELPPSEVVLCISLAIDRNAFSELSKDLYDRGMISFRKHLGHYIIAHDLDFNVDLEVKQIVDRIQEVDEAKLLSDSIPLGVEYPVLYNYRYKVTRYFNKKFLRPGDSISLEKMLEDNQQDGLIVYSADFSGLPSRQKIKEQSCLYPNVIFFAPKEPLSFYDELKQLEAAQRLSVSDNIFLNSNSAQQELDSYKNELVDYLEKSINNAFSFNASFYMFVGGERKTIKSWDNFQEQLKNILELKYPDFLTLPLVNYELINKTTLTAQMRKCRRNILSAVVINSLTPDYFEKTGADNSVARILLKNTNIWNNSTICFIGTKFEPIYHAVLQDLNDGVTFEALLNKYVYNNSTYGIRKGLFTFLIGMILCTNHAGVCISIDGNEVEFSVELLDLFESSPEKYHIALVEPSPQEAEILQHLMQNQVLLPYITPASNMLFAVYNAFRTYILSLPRSVIPTVCIDHPAISKLLEGLSVNNSKAFFYKKMPSIYKTNSFESGINHFERDLDLIDIVLRHLQKSIASAILRAINVPTGNDIVKALRNWSMRLSSHQKGELKKSPLAGIENLVATETQPSLEQLLKFVTAAMNGGIDYFYWREPANLADFVIKISNEIDRIMTGENTFDLYVDENVTLSDLAIVLKDKLKATIKGFGRTVSNQEIKNAIIQLIKELN